MMSLGLGGTITYSSGAQQATLEIDDWGAAATLNRVLWRIYPEAKLREGENLVGAPRLMLCCRSVLMPHTYHASPVFAVFAMMHIEDPFTGLGPWTAPRYKPATKPAGVS